MIAAYTTAAAIRTVTTATKAGISDRLGAKVLIAAALR
jgi:hypothetical protein